MKTILSLFMLVVLTVGISSCGAFRITSQLGNVSATSLTMENSYQNEIRNLEVSQAVSESISRLKHSLAFATMPEEGYCVYQEEKETLYSDLGPFETGQLSTTVLKNWGRKILLRIRYKDGSYFDEKGSIQIRYQGFDGKVLARKLLIKRKEFMDIEIELPQTESFYILYPVVVLSGDAINSRLIAPPLFVRSYIPDYAF